jgi:hypothetical protein
MSDKQIAAVLHADWKPRKNYTPTPEETATRRAKYASRVWHNPRLIVEDISVPDVGPKDVLVRVKACGICGSDVHMNESDSEGYMVYPGLVKTPVVIGHELSGVVEKVGNEVTKVRQGDYVVSEQMWYCGECDPCRTSFYNHCVNLQEMGFTHNGGFEQYIRVHQKFIWSIESFKSRFGGEDQISEAGALIEPACVSYNGMFVRAGGFRPGSNVAVWGAGPIGLSAIGLAKAAGAAKIIAFELIPERMEIAKRTGADCVFNPKDLMEKGTQPWEKIVELTDGKGVEMHIEAAGDPITIMPQAERSLTLGGKIVQIGRTDKTAPVFFELYQVRSLQAFGTQGHAGEGVFPRVINLIASGRLDTLGIVTARFKVSEIGTAFERIRSRTDAKIMIKP